MKKLMILALVLFSLGATAQKIEAVRVDSLQYNLFITGAKDAVKYEWTIEAPPVFNSQIMITKRDTLSYSFIQSGYVNVYVRYKNKEGEWSDEQFKSIQVK